MPSLRILTPENPSASSAIPSVRSACRTSRYVAPAAMIPTRASGSPSVRFSPLATAYRLASVIRSWACVASKSASVPPRNNADTWWVKGLPATFLSGTTASGLSESSSTVALPSTTLVASFIAVQSPQKRDIAMPWSPRCRMSRASHGDSTGMPISARAASELLGTVDDLAIESSPTSTRTPPCVSAPPRFPCRMASVALSRPGAFPYQMPTTPSTVRSAEAEASWEPCTALAASSSLTAGCSRMPYWSSFADWRPSSRSYPASGEPS
jgi:hypothetical protein